MKNTLDIIKKSNIPDNYKYYWGYQYELGKTELVPYLIKNNAFKPGFSVCEIGSAEGGALHALVEAGAENALGTDIVQSRLDMGKTISDLASLKVEYTYHNIITEDVKPEWKNSFDLVILRDVIEHLDEPNTALTNIKKLLKPGGMLFITFPPYYSPYGGHQHTLAGNFVTKLPYIHLLPKALFFNMINSGRPQDIGEVKRLKDIKLTAGKMKKAAIDTGYSVFHEDYYLIRPVFKMKFGLPPIKLTPISFIPCVKSLLCLEAAYLFRID